jgi:hypothetical protein
MQRDADFRYFTSDKTRKLIKDEGVAMIGFRRLRDLMRLESPNPVPFPTMGRG